MSNLATALAEAAERHPQRPAVRVDESVLSYAELDELSGRVAGGLLAHGVRPGDRVGMRLPNVPAFPALCFGALRAGAIVVPLYPPPRLLAPRPRGTACGARLVFYASDAERAQEAETGDTTLVPISPAFLDQMAFWPHHPAVVDRAGDDPAVILCTGEAVKGPWGTVLTHGAMHSNPALTGRALFDEAAVDDASESVPAFPSDGRTYGLSAVLLATACLPAGPTPLTPAAPDESVATTPAPDAGSGR
ncbi:long-chain acyl-CoA synthetase [Streptomyces sp. 3213]|uniref:AMP-binding protein n=1 Tax=Streptomyces sp. 3213.3 TaxID=1855348 RepID=UPI0008972D80|nr:AMP-binding protein [Streptomyces sp. 3213.3]SEF02996.1 long-chain acyl-CoA synthetase [Streptomyces sp. 3213] [Streptomyces sp. 3213.3]